MRALIVGVLLLAQPVAAQEVDCGATSVQGELNQCEYESWQAADAELNATYSEALAKARERDSRPSGSRGAEELLRAAQRAWLAYRDADCEVDASFFHGGTAEPMIRYGCMRQHTEARTQLLGYYIDRVSP